MFARLSLSVALLGTFAVAISAAPPSSTGECSGALPAPENPVAANENRILTPISKGQTDFALDLYRTLCDHETGNLFFSPTSIAAALSMTAAGARGNTADEMANVLRLKDPIVQLEDGTVHPNEELHAAIGSLLRALSERDAAEDDEQEAGPRLDIANALWGQRGYPFLESFIRFLDEHYDASLTELDFMDGERAAAIINEWVESKTEERITDLVDASIVQGAALVLTNAIYFKGDWKDPFNPDRTRDEDFHVDSETTVTVPIMHRMGRYAYTENDLLQALRLPYTGESMSMIVLLPREGKTIEDVESELTPPEWNDWLGSLQTERVNVTMPRFTMTEEFSLKDVLSAMGMSGAFDPGADFSGIDESGQLFISDVVHKAFVEVDEKGTEAAAATGVIMPTSAPTEPPKTFRADRPFLFVIHDAAADSILFMGRVMNP